MSFLGRSILDTRSVSVEEVFSLFEKTRLMRSVVASGSINSFSKNLERRRPLILTMFLEPSTRTRLSFEVATHRLGFGCVDFGDYLGSSLIKGESLLDSVENVLAMGPDVLVLRYGFDSELESFLQGYNEIPIISGGTGISSHPTQALLDAFTIFEERGQIQGEKILIIGDIAHSRVAQSNFDLLSRLGAEVGVCGPEQWMTSKPLGVVHFKTLKEGLRWATVSMSLRVQKERHSERSHGAPMFDTATFHQEFGINRESLGDFAADGIIMHPGPVNYGLELAVEVMEDSRCRIRQQVRNGVFVRMAVLSEVLGKVSGKVSDE